jgi:uncharacterized cupredoxin-like copper-binding protein
VGSTSSKRIGICGCLVILALASLTAAGCGSNASANDATNAAKKTGPTVVRVTLSDWQVKMSRTSIPADRPVLFIAGAVEHEIVLEPADSDDKPYELLGVNGTEFESEVEDIHPGSTVGFTWQLPGKGHYQLACHVPGHFEKGMVSQFSAT